MKELLKKLLKYYQRPLYRPNGLCSAANEIEIEGIISFDEWWALDDYIDNNRPEWHKNHAYAFKPGLKRPRIKLLKQWIEKETKKDES